MIKRVGIIGLVAVFFCSISIPAIAATFDISAQNVEPFDISGLTVWLEVDSDFAVSSDITDANRGSGIPSSWFSDTNLGSLDTDSMSGKRVLKLGASDFLAAIGQPLTPLSSGVLFSFDYTGGIISPFLIKLPDLNNVDHFLNGDVSIESFSDGGLALNSVPIPSALLLLGSGLVGLVGLRRKIMS